MSLSRKPRYRTTNWKQYNAALKARGSLSIWLDKRGRSPKFSDAAIQFCLTLKNLFEPPRLSWRPVGLSQAAMAS